MSDSRQDKMRRLQEGFLNSGGFSPRKEEPQPEQQPVRRSYETLPTSDDKWAQVQEKLKAIANQGRTIENPEEASVRAMDDYRTSPFDEPQVPDRSMEVDQAMNGGLSPREIALKKAALNKIRGS